MNRLCSILAAIITLSGGAAAAQTVTLTPVEALRLGSALNYLSMCEVQGPISSGRAPSHSRVLRQRYQSQWPTIVSAFKESTKRSQLPDKGALYREQQGWMALPFNETACATVDRTFVTLRKLWDATDEGL